ncbi:MAG TPA: hypothetical protein VJ746_17785, partial [Nitrospira sp.]|nr:hypothetical protein [Nitrospira sp.]
VAVTFAGASSRIYFRDEWVYRAKCQHKKGCSADKVSKRRRGCYYKVSVIQIENWCQSIILKKCP